MFAFIFTILNMIRIYIIVDAYLYLGKWLWKSYIKPLWDKWYYRPVGVRKIQ